MKLKILKKIVWLMALLLSSMSVQANMSINKILFFMGNGNDREDVEVVNTGQDTLYINASVFLIKDPENEQPERIEVKNPQLSSILVSPNKLILKPGERKFVRILVTKPATEKDIVYRIKLQPVVGDLLADETSKKEKATGVKILIAYELLAFIRPPNPHAELNVVRSGNKATFSNTGNTNMELRDVKVCDSDKVSNCQEVKARRLYAGQTWTTDLPRADGVIVVRQSVGMEFSEQSF